MYQLEYIIPPECAPFRLSVTDTANMSGLEMREAMNSPQADIDLNNSFGKAQQLNGASLSSFLASLSTSFALFALEVLVFFAIRGRFPEI